VALNLKTNLDDDDNNDNDSPQYLVGNCKRKQLDLFSTATKQGLEKTLGKGKRRLSILSKNVLTYKEVA